eukprot:GFUD01009363.1.p1 GENE.GFUD01009363.1~~GFUD01009363.1.p1  ORF type:complete len:219 (+),score=70.13 GFUD01009363.1:95-751(+)
MDQETEKTWKSLVYNVSITPAAVKEFYDGWAGLYDQDQVKLKTGADHLADELIGTLKQIGKEEPKLSILDVACGTGLVGDALVKRGFSNITGLDFCKSMLDIANKKGVYKELLESSFGAEVPTCLSENSFDCVVMKGGFAAGHLPLASLGTMAKLCKPGGVVINSMTLEYTKIVEEYRGIEEYVKKLQDEGVWKIIKRKVIEDYINGKQGVIHILQVE